MANTTVEEGLGSDKSRASVFDELKRRFELCKIVRLTNLLGPLLVSIL
jgi:hypothetical protein